MRPNFTACSDIFLGFSRHNSIYNFNGTPYGIFSDPSRKPPLITYEGCKHFCGPGTQYYAWADISSTITTWVFPVVGLLLQAPYESNKNWSTLLALARWLGNPIAGMSYTLWNIKVIGRCALMVDMASPYDEVPGPGSQFANIRDSLYLLSVMNQYAIKERLPSIDAAEKLLRIALFSDSLQLTAANDRTDSLARTREELARTLRIGRKKGVIEVFLSEALFVIALAISIYAAFSEIGSNEAAHDLGLGLLLAWLPILVLSSITDRNPVAADEIRQQLNNLLDLVRTALLDPERRESYIKTTGKREDDFAWTKLPGDEHYFHNAFFTQFAGQGRFPWHHGCAHSILASMEDAWIADHGRGWMEDADRARTRMISDVEPDHQGLVWFDRQMFWQIAGSTAILYGTSGGAFILAFYTPTVGLGCWSGNYLIYIVVATAIFAIEMLLWWCRATYPNMPGWVPQWMKHDPFEDLITQLFGHVRGNLDRQNSDRWVIGAREQLRTLRTMWKSLSFTDRLGVILRLLEIGNTIFLTYIVFAQTLGSYSNCECNCSTWSGLGGYMDFEDYAYYRANGVRYYWGAATGMSCFSLTVGLTYIVIEYCTQSHLSTEDYDGATKGLNMTRWFRKYTIWLRLPGEVLAKYMHKATFGMFKSNSKSLTWDWMTKDERIQIQMRRAQVIDGQAPRGASEAQAHTKMLGRDVREERSPIDNSSAPKTSADPECAFDATSVQESTIEGEADIQMQTRKPLPEPEPKVHRSSSRSSLPEGS